ncbi:pathogenesis-related BetVI family protein, partial [Streptomyces fildesensis]|uniref:pathogenesis-related BetVI family protein n=1 Tax=Streptomyces fildesensis TaxID=375757 RepID=UPI0027DD27A0
MEVIQGDGGPGTIKKIHFSEGHKFKFMTHRIDAVDKEHYSIKYTVIDGDMLCGFIESISHELTVSASPDGGSIYKNKIKYHTKGDEDCTEHANGGKEEGITLFKAIEAH